MTPKEEAIDLLHKYRMLFMDEGEDYGEEILVSMLSMKCALIAVDEILEIELLVESVDDYYLRYWQEVKKEIENNLKQNLNYE